MKNILACFLCCLGGDKREQVSITSPTNPMSEKKTVAMQPQPTPASTPSTDTTTTPASAQIISSTNRENQLQILKTAIANGDDQAFRDAYNKLYRSSTGLSKPEKSELTALAQSQTVTVFVSPNNPTGKQDSKAAFDAKNNGLHQIRTLLLMEQ